MDKYRPETYIHEENAYARHHSKMLLSLTLLDAEKAKNISVWWRWQWNISWPLNKMCSIVRFQIMQFLCLVGEEGVPIQVDGEAWLQPPGMIRIIHKNRMQMLCRNKVSMFNVRMQSCSVLSVHDRMYLWLLFKNCILTILISAHSPHLKKETCLPFCSRSVLAYNEQLMSDDWQVCWNAYQQKRSTAHI
jgi:hypothetical protein